MGHAGRRHDDAKVVVSCAAVEIDGGREGRKVGGKVCGMMRFGLCVLILRGEEDGRDCRVEVCKLKTGDMGRVHVSHITHESARGRSQAPIYLGKLNGSASARNDMYAIHARQSKIDQPHISTHTHIHMRLRNTCAIRKRSYPHASALAHNT